MSIPIRDKDGGGGIAMVTGGGKRASPSAPHLPLVDSIPT